MSIRPDRREYLQALARELGSLSPPSSVLQSGHLRSFLGSTPPPDQARNPVFQALFTHRTLARTLHYYGVDDSAGGEP